MFADATRAANQLNHGPFTVLTGTPLDLTPFGSLLGAIGLAYWLLVLVLVGLSLWWPKRWIVKLPLAGIVLTALVYPVASRVAERKADSDEWKARLDASMALFAERCKTAGEKITRTVEDVDGVVWMKWREKNSSPDDQWTLDDPYGRDCGADDCLLNLLRVPKGMETFSADAAKHKGGYRFVEWEDPRDGSRYRYAGEFTPCCTWTTEKIAELKRTTGKGLDPDAYRFTLATQRVEGFAARYGITWDDISTHEDREHWIAGGSLKVVDLQTNEVLAERVGYMIDRGQGSRAGFRSPWFFAENTACPEFDHSDSNAPTKASRSRAFVFKVLLAKKVE